MDYSVVAKTKAWRGTVLSMRIAHPRLVVITTRKSHHSQKCKKHAEENPAWLTYVASVNIALSGDRHRHCELHLWPFDLQNGFIGFIVEHLYVKFDVPSCISFWDIVRKIRHSGENPTSATAASVATMHWRSPLQSWYCCSDSEIVDYSAATAAEAARTILHLYRQRWYVTATTWLKVAWCCAWRLLFTQVKSSVACIRKQLKVLRHNVGKSDAKIYASHLCKIKTITRALLPRRRPSVCLFSAQYLKNRCN